MNSNNITVLIYDLDGKLLKDFARTSRRIEQLQFSTGYPGGLYLGASFFVPKKVDDWWEIRGNYRVVFLNGLKVVYEGWVSAIEYTDTADGQGVMVECIGAWSKIAMNRRWIKYWSDTRTDDKAWRMYATNATNHRYDVWSVDRSNGIKISAVADGYTYAATGEYCRLTYTAPGGQTIKRVSYDYYFYEGEDGWRMLVQYYDTSASAWTDLAGSEITTAFASGSHDLTLTTPCNQVSILLDPTADITHSATARVEASWEKICVYTETGTIDLPAVAEDVVGAFSDINSTTGFISPLASARSLCGTAALPAGFGSEGETLADLLTKAAAFGDGNNDRYAVGFRSSHLAPVPDGKPVLYVEQYPDLTDYDLSIALDDRELVGSVIIRKDYDRIYNAITVRYEDDMGDIRYITPDDDSALKDNTSIANYGRHDYQVDIGYSNPTDAAKIGYRFLATYKDPQWELSSPITVMDRIKTKSGLKAPVSHVTAGKRLRILNFLSDATGTGTGMTFLVSSTQYDDETNSVTITVGPPPDLIIPQNLRPIADIKHEYPEETSTRTTPPTPGPGGNDKEGKKRKPKTKEEKEAWEKGKWPP